MKTLKGRFTRHDETPAAGARLRLELSQDARTLDGKEVKSIESVYVTLDENGEVPPKTRIHANDELDPKGTYYTVKLLDDDPDGRHYHEWVKIEGRGPINLTDLVPLEKAPLPVEPLYFGPIVEPIAARVAPARRTPSENNIGFFAGTINCPIDNDSGRLPFIGNGMMGVFGFTLPFPSTITCAAIHVDSAPPGTHFVLLTLYDGNRKRVCEFKICVDGPGLAAGVLNNPVSLEPGDYFLGWSSTFDLVEVHTIGGKVADLMRLMNAGGGAVVAGVARTAGDSLPEVLGDVRPGPWVLPVIYFKA